MAGDRTHTRNKKDSTVEVPPLELLRELPAWTQGGCSWKSAGGPGEQTVPGRVLGSFPSPHVFLSLSSLSQVGSATEGEHGNVEIRSDYGCLGLIMSPKGRVYTSPA